MPFIESAGNTALGAIMGIGLQGINNERQIEQENKLQDIHLRGQRQMMDYSNQKQMEMWKNTNYSAQVAEMNKANINPGLLYGMSGGGGR